MVNILLIEDNPLNSDMLSRRLMRRGYQVDIATDGLEGITKTKSDLPDLILMDMNLPVIDGWDAARRLKTDQLTHAIPIIALTAHAMVGDREKALAAGCDDYDTKPVDFKGLLKKIEALIKSTGVATNIDTEILNTQFIMQEHKAAAAKANTSYQYDGLVAHIATQPQEQPALQSIPQQPHLSSTKQSTTLNVDDQIGDHYQIVRLISQNPVCETFLAEDIQKFEPCFLKRIQIRTDDVKAIKTVHRLFNSEVKSLETLSQFLQVSKLLNSFIEAQDCYLVQAFSQGSLLSNELKKETPLQPLEVLDLISKILRVLKSVHHRQLVHCDIQPDHLLLSKDGEEILLTDLGIASRIVIQLKNQSFYPGQQPFDLNQLTLNRYVAPEQYLGQPIFSSDIYSVGLIALQALTGKPPETFTVDPDTGELNWKQFAQVNQDLAQFLDKMVCQNPQERYSSSSIAMKDALFLRHAYLKRMR